MAAKKAAKKATPKKATPKKATAKKAPAKKQVTAVKEPMTKAVVISEISNNTGLNKNK